MSEPTLELPPSPGAEATSGAEAAGAALTGSAAAKPGPERVVPALGALLVVIAVTSLMDDAGIAEIAWWVPFLLAAVAVGAGLAALTIVRLLRAPT